MANDTNMHLVYIRNIIKLEVIIEIININFNI